MEHLPIEIIGIILSQIGPARETLIASTTCKKWREAWRDYLDNLHFCSDDWIVYHDLATPRLETIITQTILQTTGLQFLSILTSEDREFSAASVTAWLTHTRDTLRRLHYSYGTAPSINILEICNGQKLEELALSYNAIASVDPGYLKFPALKSLSLSFVTISVLNLRFLLAACPKLEALALIHMDIKISDEKATMKLTSASLKDVYVESLSFKKFILDSDSLENLHLKECTLEVFELVGKGSLRDLQIDSVTVGNFDIGENTENLEVVDVYNFNITWRKFYHIISRLSKLKRLCLWDINGEDGDEVEEDLETTSVCYPRLSKLSLNYDGRYGKLFYGLQGSFNLQNVTVLELGWTVMNNDLFSNWVAGLLEMCPSLKKLVIYGAVAQVEAVEDFQFLADFTKSIVQLMRKYMHIDIQFEYQ